MVAAKRPQLEQAFARPNSTLRGVLLHGPDRVVLRELGDRVGRRKVGDLVDPFAVSLLSGVDLEADPGRLGDALAAMAMTGEARLVRLRLGGEKPVVERGVAETLVAHLRGDFNPEAFLLIESEALDRTSSLRKAAEVADDFLSVAIYADEAADTGRLIRDALAQDRLTLAPAALDILIARMPQARGVIRAEVERLAMFIGPGRTAPILADDLDDFLGVEPEANLFEAATHAFGGHVREAYRGWRRAHAEGEDGPAIVRALSTHASRLRRAQSLMAAGRTAQDAAKFCKIFWKEEREFVRQLAGWRAAELDRVQPELYEADRACKSTSSIAPLLAERLLLAIAARARRLNL